MSIASKVKETEKTFLAIMTIGLIGLVMLIVYGNLSGNLGFAANTAEANNTNNVIGNLTAGATTFFSFANTWFVLLAVVLLIVIVISVISAVRGAGGRDGFSS